MADQVRLSQSEANSAKSKIANKTDSWLSNMSSLEKEVSDLANWFKGDTGNALVELFRKCQKEIKGDINRFISEYNGTIDKAVNALTNADRQTATAIGNL